MVKNSPELVVIGLDGATWNILDPLIDKGSLPNIEKIVKNGFKSNLKSGVPISTAPSWKCYSTGRDPGEMGTYFWFSFDKQKKDISMVDSNSFNGKEIWDVLSEKGHECSVLNMPTTYPPKKIKGQMISGFNALDEMDYTHPSDLKKDLIKKFDYKINPSKTVRMNANEENEKAKEKKREVIKEIQGLFRKRFDVAKWLLKEKEPDFLHLTIFYIDNIQHYCYPENLDFDTEDGKILEESWKVIDEEIGKFMDILPDETNIILMSDHGFTELKYEFRFNDWLRKEGYLTLKKEDSGGLSLGSIAYKLGLNTQRAVELTKSPLGKFMMKILPHSFLTKLWFKFQIDEDRSIVSNLDNIDWEKTKAAMIGESLLYINAEKGTERYEKIRDELMEKISKLRSPEYEEKVISPVLPEEEYREVNGKAPDILLKQNSGYRLNPSLNLQKDLWKPKDDFDDGYSAFHERDGILAISSINSKETVRSIDKLKLFILSNYYNLENVK